MRDRAGLAVRCVCGRDSNEDKIYFCSRLIKLTFTSVCVCVYTRFSLDADNDKKLLINIRRVFPLPSLRTTKIPLSEFTPVII